MEDHFTIWLSEKELQTLFIFRVMMLQLRMGKVFDHVPNEGIAQRLVAAFTDAMDVMYVTCTVFGWRLFIKVKAECIERPQGQMTCGCDAT